MSHVHTLLRLLRVLQAEFTHLGVILCVPLVFPVDEITHKLTEMLKSLPSRAVTLEQIHVFKTSMTAELAVLQYVSWCHLSLKSLSFYFSVTFMALH